MNYSDKIINWAAELQSLAQAGLAYGRDKFDIERFKRIREIAEEMISCKSGLSLEQVKNLLCDEIGYPTPKIDTRAAIFKDEEILLVRESDGRWALPGGWCEVNTSPAENTIKEAKEEAGLDVVIEKVIAVQDRTKHNAPSFVFGVTKIFYLCTALGGKFTANIETTESKYFAENKLPILSEGKCTAEQIKLCFKAHRAKVWETQFD